MKNHVPHRCSISVWSKVFVFSMTVDYGVCDGSDKLANDIFHLKSELLILFDTCKEFSIC